MSDTIKGKGNGRHKRMKTMMELAGQPRQDKLSTYDTEPRIWGPNGANCSGKPSNRDKTEGQHSRKAAKELIRQINRLQVKKARRLL